MHRVSNSNPSRRPEKGQALALVAVMMVVLLGMGALAVDLGYFFVTRNELQNIADGGALAGTRMLGNIYQGLPFSEQQTYVCGTGCEGAIHGAVQDLAARNRAAGLDMTVEVEDIAIGVWDGNTFTETPITPDAVEVVTRRDEETNGTVATFFARVVGTDEASVTAIATAALTGQGTVGEGDMELPIGISRWFFDRNPMPEFCNNDIQFYPSNDSISCAGWTSWTYGSNDVTLRRILDETDGYENPGTVAGETIYNFTGGTLSNPTFDALLSLFQRKGWDVDNQWNYLLSDPANPTSRVRDADPDLEDYYYAISDDGGIYGPVNAVALMEPDNQGNPVRAEYPDGTLRNWHKWETTVPVYDRGDCSNPNQSILIVGFAEIELRDVVNAPDKLVRGKVKCGYVDIDPSRGGGGEYGTKGSIPGLVR